MFVCLLTRAHPLLLRGPDVCLKDTMSVADSLYNLQLIKDFCASHLQSCCPLAVEDLLYAPPALHVGGPLCPASSICVCVCVGGGCMGVGLCVFVAFLLRKAPS